MKVTKSTVKIERPAFNLDTIDLQTKRAMVLMAARPACGKSYSVAALLRDGLERGFKVMVIDRDRGLAEVIEEVCGEIPPNLSYKLVRTWEDLEGAIQYAFDHLEPQDWLVFEHVGRLWDFAQDDYTRRVYGSTQAQRLRHLRAESEDIVRLKELDTAKESDRKEADKLRSKGIGYQGLDGRKDWAVIKAGHNNDIFDRVLLDGHFNVLSTTSVAQIDKADENAASLWADWLSLGIRPEGEKHQRYRHSTQVFLYKNKGRFLWRTDFGNGEGKDRGRKLMRDVDMTEVGFVRSWAEAHGVWAPKASTRKLVVRP